MPFTCNICDKIFSWKNTYKRHVKIHETCSPFECSWPECTYKSTRRDLVKRHEQTHSKDTSSECYECSECGSKYKHKDHLKRHIFNKHGERQFFECSECGFKSMFKDNLQRHIITKHGKRQFFECSECGFRSIYKDSLQRHIFTKHGKREHQFFECSECDFKFLYKDSLQRHIFTRHGKRQFFECSECGFKSVYKVNLQRHIFIKHGRRQFFDTNVKKEKKSFQCNLCCCTYQNRTRVVDHYEEDHDIHISEERLSFPNEEEFLKWKGETEKANNCSFVRHYTYRSTSSTSMKYLCHRSGSYTPKSKSNRQKRLKIRGTKKINAVCPAEIRFSQNNTNSRCTVSFVSTHVGHDLTIKDEYAYLWVPVPVKMDVAAKVSTVDDTLLHSLKNDIPREALLSASDFRNITVKCDVNVSESFQRPFIDNFSNVEAFVEKYSEFILYYKRENESDERFSMLEKSDIMLIFMSTAQEELLRKFGNNVIAMDGVHGLNNYGFILQTISVLDYDFEGIPVVFAISNRNDIVLVDVFLSCVKDRVGVLQPQMLMTDMQETYYNSWKKIMGIPVLRLFCTWHVREDWKRNFKKIPSKEKRKIISDLLYELSIERDEFIFYEKLDKLLANEDTDFTVFLDYFRENYTNNILCWAYCYRLNACINTNTHLEAFYKVLKDLHDNRKKIKDLYSGLDVAVNFVRCKLKDVRIKQIKGGYTDKLRQLRKAHDSYEKYAAENEGALVQEDQDNGVWLVPSFPDSDNKLYYVRKIRETCPVIEDADYSDTCNLLCMECDVCAHLFTCTCAENSIKNVMCKHIHAVCSTKVPPVVQIVELKSIVVDPTITDSTTADIVNSATSSNEKCIGNYTKITNNYFQENIIGNNVITENQWHSIKKILQTIQPVLTDDMVHKKNDEDNVWL